MKLLNLIRNDELRNNVEAVKELFAESRLLVRLANDVLYGKVDEVITEELNDVLKINRITFIASVTDVEELNELLGLLLANYETILDEDVIPIVKSNIEKAMENVIYGLLILAAVTN